MAPPADAPAPAPAAPRASQAEPGDVIAGRMVATRQWINSGAAGPYSIQLFVAGDEQELRNHLKRLPKFIEINNIYMYRSAAQGGPMVNVLWGSFPDRKAAQDEVAVLPASLRANRPYVRTLDVIRAEIDRQNDSGRR
jgi:septal ring-binding cell division protein DamX